MRTIETFRTIFLCLSFASEVLLLGNVNVRRRVASRVDIFPERRGMKLANVGSHGIFREKCVFGKGRKEALCSVKMVVFDMDTQKV